VSAPIFDTDRTKIVHYTEARQRTQLAADAEVRRFMQWPDADETAFAQSIQAMLKRHPLDRGGWMNLAIRLHAGGYVGDHAVNILGDTALLGIALVPAFRGQGLAAEVIAGSLACWRTAGIARFRAEVDPDNRASLALFGRLGFTVVGEGRDEAGPFIIFERG
jgi:RimJ/RimL family protein N-acetyltransferase